MAGATEALLVTPLDVIKITLEAERTKRNISFNAREVINVMRHIHNQNGFIGFYRG